MAVSNGKPTIVLADDHSGMLSKVSEILGDDFTVVAKVGDGIASIQAAVEFLPDILILDIAMPNMDGIQAAREVQRQGLKSKIIFLTVQEDPDYIQTAHEMGASFVLKPKLHTDLLVAIQEALCGRRFVSTISSPLSHSQPK